MVVVVTAEDNYPGIPPGETFQAGDQLDAAPLQAPVDQADPPRLEQGPHPLSHGGRKRLLLLELLVRQAMLLVPVELPLVLPADAVEGPGVGLTCPVGCLGLPDLFRIKRDLDREPAPCTGQFLGGDPTQAGHPEAVVARLAQRDLLPCQAFPDDLEPCGVDGGPAHFTFLFLTV